MEQGEFDRRIARLYDEVVRRGYHNQKDYLAELAKIVPSGSSVLEIGCGTGEILIPLLKSGVECEGLDCSDNMLYRLREKNNKAVVYLGDARTFEPTKNYDYVLSCLGPLQIKDNELESYILDETEAIRCLRKYASIGNGLLVNKGQEKEPIRINLKDGREFIHRELREKDYLIMIHILLNGATIEGEITHIKRRYPLDYVLNGAKEVKDFEKFKLIRF